MPALVMHSRELDSIWLVPMNPFVSLLTGIAPPATSDRTRVQRDGVGSVFVDDGAQSASGVGDGGVDVGGLGPCRGWVARGRR